MGAIAVAIAIQADQTDRSISAARDFVKLHVESEPQKRSQRHWALAISAMKAAIHSGGAYAHARSAMHLCPRCGGLACGLNPKRAHSVLNIKMAKHTRTVNHLVCGDQFVRLFVWDF